jgi:trehalose-6-phosphate synthase
MRFKSVYIPLFSLLHTDIVMQGVRQKLQAFDAFLNKHPEFQQKVCWHPLFTLSENHNKL